MIAVEAGSGQHLRLHRRGPHAHPRLTLAQLRRRERRAGHRRLLHSERTMLRLLRETLRERLGRVLIRRVGRGRWECAVCSASVLELLLLLLLLDLSHALLLHVSEQMLEGKDQAEVCLRGGVSLGLGGCDQRRGTNCIDLADARLRVIPHSVRCKAHLSQNSSPYCRVRLDLRATEDVSFPSQTTYQAGSQSHLKESSVPIND